jgi:hypothetical protein
MSNKLISGSVNVNLTLTVGDKTITSSTTIPINGELAVTSDVQITDDVPPVEQPEVANYYVSPNGLDTNPGTKELPFLTVKKLFTVIQPGQLAYLRGGIYYSPVNSVGMDFGTAPVGTQALPIRLFNYPGEFPILDCSAQTTIQGWHGGMMINKDWWHIRGIEVKNLFQYGTTAAETFSIVGIAIGNNVKHLTLERMVAHDIEGHGFGISDEADDILLLNCDAYNCADNLFGGENADGFHVWSTKADSTITLRGCRSWWNSDDGFDFFNNEGTIIMDNCWSFWNGFHKGTFSPYGNGMGVKFGHTSGTSDVFKRVATNCCAFQNRTHGFDKTTTLKHKLLNNIAYDNGYAIPQTAYAGAGFSMNSTVADIMQNNIASRANGVPGSDWSVAAGAVVNHNSWDIAATIIPEDEFVSVDSTGVNGPRKADGSLPILSFLHLKPTSRFVNAGVNVGLPYKGVSPDLGPFEL